MRNVLLILCLCIAGLPAFCGIVQGGVAKDGLLGDTTTEISKVKETLEDVSGPIKRQK